MRVTVSTVVNQLKLRKPAFLFRLYVALIV